MSFKTNCITTVFLVALFTISTNAQNRNRGGNEPGENEYRAAVDEVMQRLDLQEGEVIVDIGAGDGWWSSKMAEQVGEKGVVHAGEVDQKKVDAMKKKWATLPQLKPYLCPFDGTGLEEDSCDLAFISKTFHHFDHDGHPEYLKHLLAVVKPSGKLVIVERHSNLATGRGKDHAWLPGLLGKQAEDAGWMVLSCELIPGTDHYMATFVQPEAFAREFRQSQGSVRE